MTVDSTVIHPFIIRCSGILKNKNPHNSLITRVFDEIQYFKSGAGGSRTLVQTRNTQAFYMLILSLVFDKSKETDTLNLNLASYLNPFAKQKRMHLEIACDS